VRKCITTSKKPVSKIEGGRSDPAALFCLAERMTELSQFEIC
jgi:hypothetical protein